MNDRLIGIHAWEYRQQFAPIAGVRKQSNGGAQKGGLDTGVKPVNEPSSERQKLKPLPATPIGHIAPRGFVGAATIGSITIGISTISDRGGSMAHAKVSLLFDVTAKKNRVFGKNLDVWKLVP